MSKFHMPSFSKLIADVGDTETDQQLTRDFKVSVEVSTPKLTLPTSKLANTVYFLDTNEDGEAVLSKRNPKQRDLFEDAVEDRRETREATEARRTLVDMSMKRDVK